MLFKSLQRASFATIDKGSKITQLVRVRRYCLHARVTITRRGPAVSFKIRCSDARARPLERMPENGRMRFMTTRANLRYVKLINQRSVAYYCFPKPSEKSVYNIYSVKSFLFSGLKVAATKIDSPPTKSHFPAVAATANMIIALISRSSGPDL